MRCFAFETATWQFSGCGDDMNIEKKFTCSEVESAGLKESVLSILILDAAGHEQMITFSNPFLRAVGELEQGLIAPSGTDGMGVGYEFELHFRRNIALGKHTLTDDFNAAFTVIGHLGSRESQAGGYFRVGEVNLEKYNLASNVLGGTIRDAYTRSQPSSPHELVIKYGFFRFNTL